MKRLGKPFAPVLPLACAAVIACFSATPSTAQLAPGAPIPVQQRAAPSGQRQKVHFITQVYPDCTPVGQVVSHLEKPPAHGSVELVAIEDFPGFSADNPRAKCNGQRFPGIGVFYTSVPSFLGKDEFTVVYVTAEGYRRVMPFEVTTE